MKSVLKTNEQPTVVSLELPVGEILSLVGPKSVSVGSARGRKGSMVNAVLPKKVTRTAAVVVGAAAAVKLVSSVADQIREMKQDRQIKKMKKRIDELESKVQELEKKLAAK